MKYKNKKYIPLDNFINEALYKSKFGFYMKFILILQVCSFLTGECKPPVTIQTPYDNWAECAIDASLQSVKLLRQEGKDYIINDGDVMHFLFNV